jgi:hypothetical protein
MRSIEPAASGRNDQHIGKDRRHRVDLVLDGDVVLARVLGEQFCLRCALVTLGRLQGQ